MILFILIINIVQIIKDSVYARELVEHTNGNSQKNRQAVLPTEERLRLFQALQMDGVNDFLQLLLRIFRRKEQDLRNDEVRDIIVNRRAKKNDIFL